VLIHDYEKKISRERDNYVDLNNARETEGSANLELMKAMDDLSEEITKEQKRLDERVKNLQDEPKRFKGKLSQDRLLQLVVKGSQSSDEENRGVNAAVRKIENELKKRKEDLKRLKKNDIRIRTDKTIKEKM
jgi:hypothetical protein